MILNEGLLVFLHPRDLVLVDLDELVYLCDLFLHFVHFSLGFVVGGFALGEARVRSR